MAALVAPAGPVLTHGLALDLAVDLAVDLAAGLTGTVASWTGRLLRAAARDVVVVLRRGGPLLVALLTGPRAWRTAQPAVAGSRPRPVPAGPPPSDGPRTISQIPAPRSPRHDAEPSAGDTNHRHQLALPADATAPGRGRALLRDAARAWRIDEDAYQDAALVVTELIANAVDHARTPSTLTLELTGGPTGRTLRVTVRDARPGRVLRALPVDPTAPRGRGLQMIEALASSWGVIPEEHGKTVWAVLPCPQETSDRASSGSR